ncbi:DUF4430 domain-containing protein [Solibacillus sp. CAU 1738]|uniref:DUF4430 domain-containing protein n=1 Tax=Solibacillus sp. CAU 1738 TaxID=3140363 RepID=UPI0032608DC2
MKKTMHYLAVAIFVFLLAACNIQSVEQYEQMQEHERSLDSKSTLEQEQQANQKILNAEQNDENVDQKEIESEDEEDELVKKEDASTQKNNEKQQQVKKQETETEEKDVVSDKKKSEQPTNKDSVATKPNSNEQKSKTEKPKVENPKQPPVEITEKPAEKKRTVTIAIHVDTLLKHWDLLEPALQNEKYVPKDGIVLKQTTYELLSEKDTVWDILQRATKEHKIQMEYQGANENIYNSVYVEGINHLYEFSAGELSGWMYKVNGVYPNYGCSQYVLKDGDVIEWHYTVDLGRDLGHFWDGN